MKRKKSDIMLICRNELGCPRKGHIIPMSMFEEGLEYDFCKITGTICLTPTFKKPVDFLKIIELPKQFDEVSQPVNIVINLLKSKPEGISDQEFKTTMANLIIKEIRSLEEFKFKFEEMIFSNDFFKLI